MPLWIDREQHIGISINSKLAQTHHLDCPHHLDNPLYLLLLSKCDEIRLRCLASYHRMFGHPSGLDLVHDCPYWVGLRETKIQIR